MTTSDLSIRLELIEQNQELILSMLRQLVNPAASLSSKEKADEIIKALRTGDRKHYHSVMKQINGQ